MHAQHLKSPVAAKVRAPIKAPGNGAGSEEVIRSAVAASLLGRLAQDSCYA